MAVTGKTGADAVYIALKQICKIITRYGPKLQNVINLATTAGVITVGEATVATTFIAAAQGACDIFAKIAGFSGF